MENGKLTVAYEFVDENGAKAKVTLSRKAKDN